MKKIKPGHCNLFTKKYYSAGSLLYAIESFSIKKKLNPPKAVSVHVNKNHVPGAFGNAIQALRNRSAETEWLIKEEKNLLEKKRLTMLMALQDSILSEMINRKGIVAAQKKFKPEQRIKRKKIHEQLKKENNEL